MKTGVYTITNLVNGKIYVGSTMDSFKRRCYNHYSSLSRGIHKNKHLQSSYNKYGKDNLLFEILEICELPYCLSQEQYWINMLNVCNPKYGYNNASVTGTSFGVRRTLEQKNKMSLLRKEKYPDGAPWIKGRKNSKQQLINISNGLKNYFKENINATDILKKLLSKPVLKFDLDNNFIEEYYSCTYAAKMNNTYRSSIISCCKGNSKTSGGFKWKYKDEYSSN